MITLLIAACAPPDKKEPVAIAADLVFQSGNIYTVHARRSWAQAIAIRNGAIIYVATDAAAAEHVGPDTKVVELNGRMMLPAFRIPRYLSR